MKMQLSFKTTFILLIGLSIGLISSCKNQPKATPSSILKTEFVKSGDISLEQAKAMITEGKVKIIDVRTPEETSNGMIPNAQPIDFRAADFQEKISSFNKDGNYLIYCKSGGRSSNSLQMMQKMGYKNVYNMLGGYDAWASDKK